MKKITALFLSTMMLISIVGCSAATNSSSNRSKDPEHQNIAFRIGLPDDASPTESVSSPSITETVNPTETVSSIETAMPTASASPSSILTASPSSDSILQNLKFGDSVSAVQAYAGSDASIIDDGNGDTLTYQDVTMLNSDHGTLRYGFSSLGQLNRLQFACRLTASPSSASDTSIEQMVDQITSLYGQANVAVLGRTWMMTDSDRAALITSSLAESSQVFDTTSDHPLLVWPNGDTTIAATTATASDIATTPISTPVPSYLPATTLAPTETTVPSPIPTETVMPSDAVPTTPASLLPAAPIISESATPSDTTTIEQTTSSGISLLTYLNSKQEDAQTLETALQNGAYLEYLWKQEDSNIVLSIRNSGSTSQDLYAVLTITPSTQPLSATFERIASTDTGELSDEQIQALLSSATLTYSDAALNTLFDTNGLAAEAQLQNQGAIISGEIASIDRNALGQPTITFVQIDSQNHTPIFIFDEDELASLLSLKKGDSINIVGIYDSHTESNVTFAHCQLRS